MKIGICAGAKQIAQLKKGMADYAELNLSQAVSYTHLDVYKRQHILCFQRIAETQT